MASLTHDAPRQSRSGVMRGKHYHTVGTTEVSIPRKPNPMFGPDWRIPVFRHPLIVSPYPLDPKECGCSWVWAPSISRVPGNPFVIKVPYKFCRIHGRIYYPLHD